MSRYTEDTLVQQTTLLCHPEGAYFATDTCTAVRMQCGEGLGDNRRDSSPQKAQLRMTGRLGEPMSKEYYVYIMTNKSRTLYTGVTNNLMRRVYEHKNKLVEGFTSKYNIQFLVYYESTNDVHVALAREKQIKGWLRSKKIALIDSMNPKWKDLSEEWYVKPEPVSP